MWRKVSKGLSRIWFKISYFLFYQFWTLSNHYVFVHIKAHMEEYFVLRSFEINFRILNWIRTKEEGLCSEDTCGRIPVRVNFVSRSFEINFPILKWITTKEEGLCSEDTCGGIPASISFVSRSFKMKILNWITTKLTWNYKWNEIFSASLGLDPIINLKWQIVSVLKVV